MPICKSYSQAAALLASKKRFPDQYKLERNTWLKRRSSTEIAVQLHATDIIRYFADGTVVVRDGGWDTVTTRDRINSYSSIRIWHERNVAYFAIGDQCKSRCNADDLPFIWDGECKYRAHDDGRAVEPLSKHEVAPYKRSIAAGDFTAPITNVALVAYAFATATGRCKLFADSDCWLCALRDDEMRRRGHNYPHGKRQPTGQMVTNYNGEPMLEFRYVETYPELMSDETGYVARVSTREPEHAYRFDYTLPERVCEMAVQRIVPEHGKCRKYVKSKLIAYVKRAVMERLQS